MVEEKKKKLLTISQREVVKRMGMTNQDIANELCLELCTVKVHVHNILKKLDVDTRTLAILKALYLGEVKPSEIVIPKRKEK